MKKNLKRSLIFIYFILLCCVFLSTALSKNVSKVSAEAGADVAGMQLNVITKQNNITNLDNTQQSISFVVKNYEGTTDDPIYSDIEYTYQISITTAKNVPLEYELYKVENGNETKINLENGRTTDTFTMPHSKIKEDTYILKVKLDDKNYKNIEDVLNIDVYAVQS